MILDAEPIKQTPKKPTGLKKKFNLQHN